MKELFMLMLFRLMNLFSAISIIDLYSNPDRLSSYSNTIATVIEKGHKPDLYLLLAFLFGFSFLSWFIGISKTTRVLNDIPYALKYPYLIFRRILNNCIVYGFIFFIIYQFWPETVRSNAIKNDPDNAILFASVFSLMLLLSCCLGLFFYNYGIGIIIDAKKNYINFPAKNKLSSLSEFITLRFLLGQFFRRTVKFTDILYVHNVTESKTVAFYHCDKRGNSKKYKRYKENVVIKKYLLNCAGNFGSFYLPFSSIQKRDEAISAIKAAAEELNHKIEYKNILY